MLPDPCGTGFVQNFPHLPPQKVGKNKRKEENYRKKVYRKNSTIKRPHLRIMAQLFAFRCCRFTFILTLINERILKLVLNSTKRHNALRGSKF